MRLQAAFPETFGRYLADTPYFETTRGTAVIFEHEVLSGGFDDAFGVRLIARPQLVLSREVSIPKASATAQRRPADFVRSVVEDHLRPFQVDVMEAADAAEAAMDAKWLAR